MSKVELETTTLERIEFTNKGDINFDTNKVPINADNLNQMQTNTNNVLDEFQTKTNKALSDIQDNMLYFSEETTLNDLVIKSNLLNNNSKINANAIAVVNDNTAETLNNYLTKHLDKLIVDYTFTDSTNNSVSFDVDINPSEKLEIEIFGGATALSDVALTINDIVTGYYQCGYYSTGSATSSDADLSSVSSKWRPNKNSFYFSHTLPLDFGLITGELSLKKSVGTETYMPFYKWNCNFGISGYQGISSISGWLDSNISNINKLTFKLNSANSYFKAGTTIKIIKKAL